MSTKQEIRSIMRKRAAESSREAEKAASEELCRRLVNLQEYKDAGTVLCYMALPGEVSLKYILSDNSKCFVLPKVAGNSLELRKYDKNMLTEGYLGILEPSADAPLIDASEIDLAIIPGVAFDKAGHRLGHGKGFYDRLLPLLHCPLVGICFDYRMMDYLECDPWDISVDQVLTVKL